MQRPTATPSNTNTNTDIDPQPLKLLVRRRRLNGVIAQDKLRGWHEVRLPEVEDGAGRVVQEAFEESVVFEGEPSWLAVWEAEVWARSGGHCSLNLGLGDSFSFCLDVRLWWREWWAADESYDYHLAGCAVQVVVGKYKTHFWQARERVCLACFIETKDLQDMIWPHLGGWEV